MNDLTAARIARFQPDVSWFHRGPAGIHGIVHECRVLIWTQVLATMAGEEDLQVDADVLGWAAAIHDTRRCSDGIDAEHGERAARWLEIRPDLLPASVSLERVAYLCHWHVPPDNEAPNMTDELKVFKDADALDRWRIFDLDPSYLRTRAAGDLTESSRALWSATREVAAGESTLGAVVETAIELGILAR